MVVRAVREGQPWFRRWPRASVAVAVLLYAGIFALRMTTGGPTDVTTMFFVLPISLLAVAFGVVAGLLGGLVAIGFVATWAIVQHVALSPVGWATRAVPMLLLGVLLGWAADQLRRSDQERARLDRAAHWHRQAVEINDSIVQGLAVAKWSLEAGKPDRGLAIVTETLDHAQTMVSQLLRDAELQPGGTHENGSLSALSLSALSALSAGADRSAQPNPRAASTPPAQAPPGRRRGRTVDTPNR